MDRTRRHTFCSCDLDIDLMTLIYKLHLDFLKMQVKQSHTRLRVLGTELIPVSWQSTRRRHWS